MESKLVSLHGVSRIISDMPTVPSKRIVVFTSGVFDVPHVGHTRYLNTAKKMGDILIVGIHSDELVKERKGPDRPIYPAFERIELISNYRCVDFVLELKNQDSVYETIRQLRPDILVVSETTTDIENCPQIMSEFFGSMMQVKIIGACSSRHSTDVIKTMQEEFVGK